MSWLWRLLPSSLIKILLQETGGLASQLGSMLGARDGDIFAYVRMAASSVVYDLP